MMVKKSLNGSLRSVVTLLEVQRLRAVSDQELVERFAQSRDEAAFRVIVERHGPMVHGVCLRALGCPHDAEDAFQATFLIFSQRAGSIRKSASLASWLHGVARRVTNELQRSQHRRQRREQAATTPTTKSPVDELSWAEVKTGLDEELERLPAAYREVVVLCYLEGQTRDEAAQRLGVEVGVVKGRLERGRKLLADRMTKRGLTLSAGLLTVALSPGTVSATARAGSLFAAGESLVPVVSPSVISLTNNVLKGMVMTKLKLIAASLVCSLVLVSAVAVAAGGLLYQTLAAQPPKSEPGKAQPGVPGKEPPGVPTVAELKPVIVKQDAQIQRVAWSADDKLVATIGTRYEIVESRDSDGKNPQNVLMPHSTVKVWDAMTGELKKSLGEEKDTYIYAVAFSPDKKRVAIAGSQVGLAREKPGRGDFVRILNAGTWAVEQELDDPAGVSELAFSPDGKVLALGGGSYLAEKGTFVQMWDVGREKIIGGTKLGAGPAAAKPPEPGERPKGQEWLRGLAFSPDGKTLAAAKFSQDSNQAWIELFDGTTGASKAKWDVGKSKGWPQFAFSADGKSLVTACGPVKFWDVKTGKEQRTLDTKGLEMLQVAVSPDGLYLATCGVRKEKDKFISDVRLWSAKTGGLMKVVSFDPPMWARSIEFSSDGKTLAIGTQTDADVRSKGSEKVKGELQLVPVGR